MAKVSASAKSIRTSPRKVGVVAALIRGRKVDDALTILEHTPRRSKEPLLKLLNSAKANAENNHGLTSSSLMIDSIFVTPGPRLKRFRPAARGRGFPYQKKSSHIFIGLSGEAPKTKSKKPAETKAKEGAGHGAKS